MARARILPSKVSLTLSIREVAALHALICRVGPKTNLEVADATLDVFSELDDVRDELASQNLGIAEFREFETFRGNIRELR